MDLAPWEQEELEQWRGEGAKTPVAEEARPSDLSGETLRTHVNRSPAPPSSTISNNYEPPRPTLPRQPLRTQTADKQRKSQELGPGLQKIRDNALSIILLAALAAFGLVFYSNCSVFVVAPTDAHPKGATLITSRLSGLKFIDSADGFLTRQQGGATPAARATMTGHILESAKVYVELPYSGPLHRFTTGSK